MVMKKLLFMFLMCVVILLIPLNLLLAGPKPAEGEKTVVLLNVGMQSPYPPVYESTLEARLSEASIKMIMFDGKFDAQLQANQMDEAIAMKPNAIVLFAADSKAMVTGIKKAYDAGIPVITSNTLPAEEAVPYTVCYFGPNNLLEGNIAGEETDKLLGGKGNVVIIEGSTGHEGAISRTKGFEEKLSPGIKVLAKQPADWVKDKAARVMSDFLTRFGDKIDAVWAHSDDMAAGAAIAMEEAGYKPGDIPIVSLGGAKDGMNAMSEGWIVRNIIQCPDDESNQLAPFVIKVVNEEWKAGQQWDPYWNYMNTPVATPDNYKQYMPGCY
jgi:ribose transport system substrate-binding protein